MSHFNSFANSLEEIVQASKKTPIPIKAILEKLDRSGFSLITLALVLPFMQPFPVGPISVLGGMTFILVGLQMWKGQSQPTLPNKILNIELSFKIWNTIAKAFFTIIKWSNKISRSRLSVFSPSQKKVGSILVVGGILMAIPFGILPFNNFFPGLAILFATLAQFEKDGLFILIAWFWLIFSMLYFSTFFIGIYWLGFQGTQSIMSWVL